MINPRRSIAPHMQRRIMVKAKRGGDGGGGGGDDYDKEPYEAGGHPSDQI